MAPPPYAPSVDPFHLRSITNTLTNTPESSLPSEIPTIVSTLHSIPILETAFHTTSTKNEDTTVLLHKYKTRVSSLLQSRSPQGKWAGVALVKASVESSPEALGAWAKGWVPLVMALLGRPEPTATLTLSLSTLSAIFNLLTPSKPTLTRELTTPHLKSFLEATLHLVSPAHSSAHTSDSSETPTITDSPTLLPSALCALAQTLPAHATTFRPFVKRTRSIVLTILSSPPYTLKEEVESLAHEILVNLHLCATPSRGASESFTGGERNTTANAISTEWTNLLHCTISDLSRTLDVLFSPVLEDPSLILSSSTDSPLNSDLHLCPPADSPCAQSSRALLLLRLLTTFFTLPTTVPVTTPLSTVLTLTQRILSITPSSAYPNPTYPTSSRDKLFALLPQLHYTTLSVLDVLARRLSELFIPASLQTLTPILSLWDYAKSNSALRAQVYSVLNTLLTLIGGGLPKGPGLKKIMKIAEHAVDDILSQYPSRKDEPTIIANSNASTSGKRKKGGSGSGSSSKTSTAAATATLADTLLNTATSIDPFQAQPYTHTTPLPESKIPTTLLLTLLTHLPPPRIPSELRTKIDKTAILTNNRELLLASVLYPPGYVRSSLVPFLAAVRSSRSEGAAHELGVQGVIWPRMPVVRVGEEDVVDEEGGEEEEDVPEAVEQMNVDTDIPAHNGNRDVPLSREEKWTQALRTSATTTTINPSSIQPSSQITPPQFSSQPPSQHPTATPTATPTAPLPPSTPSKPPTITNPSSSDLEDTIRVLPTLTPAAKQLHREIDMLRSSSATAGETETELESPHPTKRAKLTPSAITTEVEESETIVVRRSVGAGAGAASKNVGSVGKGKGKQDDNPEDEDSDDDPSKMTMPDIVLGSDEDDDDEEEEEDDEEDEEDEDEEGKDEEDDSI